MTTELALSALRCGVAGADATGGGGLTGREAAGGALTAGAAAAGALTTPTAGATAV